MKETKNDVWAELKSFKRKYYTNLIIKGSLLLVAVVLTTFLLINTLEFSFRFGSEVRLGLFVILLISLLASCYLFLYDPMLKLMGKRPGMSDEEAAGRIGKTFPEVSDRLLNLIQLKKVAGDNRLASAGVEQKTRQVGNIVYSSSIKFKENGKYLKYVLSPVSVIAILLIAYPAFITEPSDRIMHFREDFVPKAPFTFVPEFESFGFRNEDFRVSLRLDGNAFPQSVYIISKGRKIKMIPTNDGVFEHVFKNLQDSRTFRFEGAGFFSREYGVQIVDRPNLRNFNVELMYPRYTGMTNERLSNIGNLEVPEGTDISWQFSSIETDSLTVTFHSESAPITGALREEGIYELSKKLFESDNYTVQLHNKYSNNKELIRYNVRVVKDAYPEIELNIYQDTVLYSMIALGGNISDDYGLSRLALKYSLSGNSREGGEVKTLELPINRNQNSQGFYYQWELDSLQIQPGQKLSYYLEVWDNDGVNGRKSSKTGLYQFITPTRAELKDELETSNNKTESEIEKSLEDSKELQRKLREAEERLKGTRELDWEDEKLIKEILEQQQELNKALEEIREMNLRNQNQRERFSPQSSAMQEKSQQLQEIMEQLMDEETRRLFEELQKLLEEDSGVEQMQELMEQLNRRTRNFDKEMERTLELFKRLKLENEINEAVNELNELAKEQLNLSEKTADQENDPKELLEEQNELIDRFNELDKDLEKIGDLNQDLDSPEPLPDQTALKKNLEEQLEKSRKNLEALKEAIEEQSKTTESNQGENEESKSGDQSDKKESGDNAEANNKKNQEGSSGESEKEKESSEENKGNTGQEKEENQSGENNSTEGNEKNSSGENQGKESEQGTGKQEQGEENNSDSSEKQNESKNGENESESMKSPQPGSRQEAKEAQQRAGRIIKQMADQMNQMQAGMQLQRMEEDLEYLRNIVHNLLTLSFGQEELMANFREVNESDPGFVPLSQQQLKLRDDARVIEDSLYSLAKRSFQLQSVIPKKVSTMNEHMENAMSSLKERRKYRAVSEQQFAMTEMNDLALLLDDMLNQLMNNVASMKGSSKSQKDSNNESLSEMQQKLNEQVQQLKESGKTGRELSEELAKLAAEQARIRRALQEMQKRLEQMDTGEQRTPGSDIPGKMEDSELDLVNKRLTENLIRRQKDIMTRLLEAENAMRERELDEERKGETAKDYEKIIPRSFDEYLKQKEKEIEMLKTLPPRLYPHYKKEVSDYFKRIGEFRP